MAATEDKLAQLIFFLEEERDKLQKVIDDYLKEYEYLMAHYHSRALWELKSQINTLKRLDDISYEEKMSSLRYIEHYKEMSDDLPMPFAKKHFDELYAQEVDKLEKLNAAPKQSVIDKEYILEELVRKLMANKIKGLRLVLNSELKLHLKFTYSNRSLLVTLPYLKRHLDKWTISEKKLNSMKGLGFEIAGNGTRLIMVITGDKESILTDVKLMLAKLFFETFFYREFENKCFFEFSEKNSDTEHT